MDNRTAITKKRKGRYHLLGEYVTLTKGMQQTFLVNQRLSLVHGPEGIIFFPMIVVVPKEKIGKQYKIKIEWMED